MPTAELGTPLIAAVLLVISLATFLSLGSSMHLNPATNTAHLRATLRPHDEDLRHTGSIRPTTPDS